MTRLKVRVMFEVTPGQILSLEAYSIRPVQYTGACKSLARSGRKQATTTEDFDVRISYL